MKSALQGINQDAASKGTKVDYVYMNYASEDQDVVGSYGSENKKFLQEVSKKYDQRACSRRAYLVAGSCSLEVCEEHSMSKSMRGHFA
ncbi:hypothetical protein F5X97DRAFT_317605 [Nemania serpens]|nr:hypothetical protein F5X97DRAFT_317605 [Nemania serpens]